MGLHWLVAGLLLPFGIHSAPRSLVLAGVVLCIVLLPVLGKKPGLLILLAGCAWTAWHIDHQSRSWGHFGEPRSIKVEGHIASLPAVRDDYAEFQFVVEAAAPADIGARFLVRWYRDWPELRAGQRWSLDLNLKPARSRVNFAGQGREPWFFTNRISVIASVNEGHFLEQGSDGSVGMLARRERLSRDIAAILDAHPAYPVIATLAVADRRFLDNRHWQLFQTTGTAHLLAISGLHVGIAATMGWWLARLIMSAAPAWMMLRFMLPVCWLSSLVTAGAYASLSGFPDSTQRALIMLCCLALAKLSARNRSPWRALILALALVLLLDPLAPLGAGLWLSFGTVAALAWAFSFYPSGQSWWRVALRAQVAIMLVGLPLGMLIFQRLSPGALPSNLLAIPWASTLVVPPTVTATLLLPLLPGLAEFTLYVAAENMRWLGLALAGLGDLRLLELRISHAPALLSALLAVAGAAVALLPPGLTRRLVALLLFTPLLSRPSFEPGQARFDLLDTGQGLAFVARSGNRSLLYDSGPGDGKTWSLVPGVIAPALAASGGPPESVIISHGDLDHAGGLHDLEALYAGSRFIGVMRYDRPGMGACKAGDTFKLGKATARVLHPRPGLPYLGNDSSCVVSFEHHGVRLLLTGDISNLIEQRLVLEGVAKHDVLLAAHHGSNSSTSTPFLDALQPRFALNSAAKFNRYGFPHPAVRQRLEAHGTAMISTSDCGGIRLDIDDGGNMKFSTARVRRAAPWRWPAEASCP